MGSVQFTLTLLFSGMITATCVVEAAEIVLDAGGDSGDTIHIIGEIEDGDAERFREALTDAQTPIHVRLWSPGGKAIEAMLIGTQIREAYLTTQAPDAFACVTLNRDSNAWWPENVNLSSACTCNSACFLIWSAGVERGGGWNSELVEKSGRETLIGIHRPRFDDKYFSSLSAEDASGEYAELLQLVRGYLQHMAVPDTIIEKMVTVSSSDIYFLTSDELDLIGGLVPTADEWLHSKCRQFALTEAEEDDYQVLHRKQVSRLLNESNPEDYTPAPALSNAESYYVEVLRERRRQHTDCVVGSIAKEQEERLPR